ncbi:hypothetical protein [uncultured Algibacter sp.]|uniref:hypothetical protein n=1 Tax=uncultured Algibacter sp. TaxID=298659 RepID=UPI003216FE9A
MGGEGAMAAANASLKNNRGQMSKRKDRKALEGSYAHIELKDFPKATEAQLHAIKEKINKENRQARVKHIIMFVIMALALVLFLRFVVF